MSCFTGAYAMKYIKHIKSTEERFEMNDNVHVPVPSQWLR